MPIFQMDTQQIILMVFEFLSAIFLACLGGMAKLLYLKDKKKITKKEILEKLLISSFIGIMAMFFVQISGKGNEWRGVFAGMGGWIGPEFLAWATQRISKVLKVKEDGEDE